MYLYFDNGGTLRTLIPHGEIPRQGNPLNLYLCFDEDRFDEESRQNFIIKIRFTFPDGTLSNEYTINPLQTDSNNNGYYLGLQQFEKLSDSEITFALKPGMEYHMFKYGFTGADRITTLYGKVLIHISFVYKEYDEEGNVLGENVYEENGTFHIERTIGSNLKQSVITPDEYTELQNLINRYILEFNDITFITDVESLESVELPDIRHLYRVKNAEEKLEYYNYRDEKWHRFVTGDEFADLVAKNNNHEQRISVLEPKVEDLEKKADNLQEQIYDEVDCREQEVDRLDKLIGDHKADVDLFKEEVGDRFSVVHNTLNEKINRDFSGLGVASSVHKEDTVIVRCAGCNGDPVSTYTLTIGALTELINSEVDYFKGYHASLAALQSAHQTGEPGDYAFVATEKDDQYHMYVWDEEQKPGRWEETISGQYALASSFEEFQQRLTDGSVHVGAVKGNVENIPESSPSLLNIEINGNKYVLPSVALDFLGDAVDGAYKLGAIKINGDTWNINNDIIDLEISDENIEGAYELGSMIINGNKWNVLKTSFVEEKIEELRAYMEANNFNKGEFLSLEKLQEKHPEGKPGEFAFVNTPTDQGDVMLMYVWDEDANIWRETTSNQYVLNSTFEQFKEQVNSVLNITDALTFELSSERQEGANELGSIRIGEDVWNIPQGGGSGSAPKKYTFSGVPVYMGDDLIPHLCGVEITDAEIINEIKKVINRENTVQVYYGSGYDISKSSYLFTSAINFFTMDIITTGGLPSSGHGVAIICMNNQYYYCDTDFWDSNNSTAIAKTINLTFKFIELGNSSGGGNTSNNEGSVIKKITFTDRPSLYEWLVSNYQNVIKFQIEQGSGDDYMFHNFSTVTKVNHAQLGVQFCVSFTDGYLNAENNPDTTTTIFSIKEDQVQQVNLRHYSFNNELEPQINGIVLLDEYWSPLNVIVTCVYIEL